MDVGYPSRGQARSDRQTGRQAGACLALMRKTKRRCVKRAAKRGATVAQDFPFPRGRKVTKVTTVPSSTKGREVNTDMNNS